MGNETQVNQEGGAGIRQSQTGYHCGNSNTTKKPGFESNIIDLKDAVFAQGHPSDTDKCEYLVKNLINYVQQEYSVGFYLGQAIQERKVSNLALSIKPIKDKKNQTLSLIWICLIVKRTERMSLEGGGT